jgi:hypothetical protein
MLGIDHNHLTFSIICRYYKGNKKIKNNRDEKRMKKSQPKIIPKDNLNREKLTWTEPLFPTGETPSPKTSVLVSYLKGSPGTYDISEIDKLIGGRYLQTTRYPKR